MIVPNWPRRLSSHCVKTVDLCMTQRVEAFKLTVPDTDIADLRERLRRTRFPDQAPGPAWAHGTDVAWIRGLLDYWREKFDWTAQEARLNAFPQYKVRLHNIDLHFLHVEGQGSDPYPLLLSHGWPGSVFEFLELIPRLTNPSRFGGDPADAFTVVAPSLPGYGLSFSPGQPRFGVEEIADCFASLMRDVLGWAVILQQWSNPKPSPQRYASFSGRFAASNTSLQVLLREVRFPIYL